MTLERDTAPGSGRARPGVIDRDIVYDDLGVPFLPGRRVKGVLREAYTEVHEALVFGNLTDWSRGALLSVDTLFGAPGAATPGALRVGDVRVPNAARVHDWLRWAAHASGGAFTPEAVLQTFTTVRRQTALDPATGGPVPNSLRATRVLRRALENDVALVFEGEVEIKLKPSEQELGERSLAFACAAARRLGLSRNRGLGRVRVQLVDENGDDLSESAMSDLSRWVFGGTS